jgi:ABC-2 type transport system ATP-binding protein
MPTAALRCEDLVKTFAGTTAVAGLNLTVPTGAIFGLLGPNGSGKTSTIRTSLGLYVPDGGHVELLGSRDPLAVRHRVGYLPEERGLYAKMKVAEQLAFLAAIRGLDQAEADRRAHAWLDRVGLAANARSDTGELSKGMQQKVQFAAAVIHEPDLIVLDEPFTGLDPINSRLLKDLIIEQRDRGATVVLSTHLMEQVEALCESICLIHRGEPVLDGVLADIRAGYGRNTVVVEYEGDGAGPLTDLPGVRRGEDTGQEARLELDAGADPQAVIRAVVDRVAIRSVRLEHPSLEDIYLERVGASTPPAAEVAS